MIKRQLPANIYRCKGIVFLADDPSRRYVLQVVGRRVDLVPDRGWADKKPRNRLVAIAHKSTLVKEQLHALFESCVDSAGDLNLSAGGGKETPPRPAKPAVQREGMDR